MLSNAHIRKLQSLIDAYVTTALVITDHGSSSGTFNGWILNVAAREQDITQFVNQVCQLHHIDVMSSEHGANLWMLKYYLHVLIHTSLIVEARTAGVRANAIVVDHVKAMIGG